MEISDKNVMSLNLDISNDFQEKSIQESLDSKNLEIDVDVNEEDEQLLKLREIPRRKSSTGSTSASKPEDPSELFSCPSSPINQPVLDFQQKGVFFGKDRNCSNPVSNFYQITEEYLRKTLNEYKDYNKTKNYMLKKEYFRKISKENEDKKEENPINTTCENKAVNNNINNNTYSNPMPIKAVPAIIGAFTTNPYRGNKGKFDLPIYYCVGFYQLNSSNLSQRKEILKTEEKIKEKESPNNDEKKEEINNNIKPNDKKEQTMIIGTPIFFNPLPSIPKICFNKMYKKKTKVFTEREGDWVCKNCKNLNFAFRVECNRCQLPKDSNEKKDVVEKGKEKTENQEQKWYKKNYKNKKWHNHYNNKGNEKGKE